MSIPRIPPRHGRDLFQPLFSEIYYIYISVFGDCQVKINLFSPNSEIFFDNQFMGVLGEDLVKRISDLIDQKGLKRTDLYKITPSSSLTRWKNGQGPNAYTLYEVSKFLGESIDYLVTGKPPAGLSEGTMAIARAAERLSPEGQKVALHQVEALAADFPFESSGLSNRA
jgi:hypothetical protein